MLRRDIFNILLGNAATSPVTQETVASIDVPSYLKTESTTFVVQEYQDVVLNTVISTHISADYAFSISWSTLASATRATSLRLGLNADVVPEHSGIDLGLYPNGRLYIGDTIDKRELSEEKLKEGFRLKLDVTPQAGKSTYAKLSLTDSAGLALSIVKTKQYATSEWEGNIVILGQELKDLRIEGRTVK